MATLKRKVNAPIAGYASTRTALQDFVGHVFAVLTGAELVASIKVAIRNKNCGSIPIRILFGLVEVIFYTAQIIFPFFILGCFVLMPYCY